jgi:hypothetical protein
MEEIMKTLICIAAMLCATAAMAAETKDVALPYCVNGPCFSDGSVDPAHLIWGLDVAASKACPNGWVKNREFTVRKGSSYFLHFNITCTEMAGTDPVPLK